MECIKFCPRVRAGDETVIMGEEGKPIISEELCVGCGICIHKCPFDAIKMDHDYELAVYDRIENNIFNKERLSRPESYYSVLRPNNYNKEEIARAEAEAAKAARKAARQQKTKPPVE